MQTNTLFITLMNIEFKTVKLSLSKTEEHSLSLSFSVSDSLLIRVIKRVSVCTINTVSITKRVYDIFS